MAQRMGTALGQTVVVENVGGAGGSIGARRVATAKPDGYTFVIGQWDNFVANGVVYNLEYDVQRDFAPIGLLSINPQLILARKTLPVETSRHAFAYVFDGEGRFRDASQPGAVQTEMVGPDGVNDEAVPSTVGNRSLVLFDRGDEVVVQTGEKGIRFLLVSGKPIEEPVAWYGPIVMNTEQELRRAYAELRDGTFIRKR